MSSAATRVPGSVVALVCDDAESAPPWQTRRLERALGAMFPVGCGIAVSVEVAWSEPGSAWAVWRAVARDGAGGIDITANLRESLHSVGLPVERG